jgi:glucose-6-phosphate isomerase
LKVENTNKDILIPEDEQNLDSLNYISGKTLQFVNHKAMEGTMMAHVDGGVPNIQLSISKIDEYNLGQLIYFFEISCALSGYILDVNPFDQPGVEAYKSNMFKLLGKPGV